MKFRGPFFPNLTSGPSFCDMTKPRKQGHHSEREDRVRLANDIWMTHQPTACLDGPRFRHAPAGRCACGAAVISDMWQAGGAGIAMWVVSHPPSQEDLSLGFAEMHTLSQPKCQAMRSNILYFLLRPGILSYWVAFQPMQLSPAWLPPKKPSILF